MQHVCSPDHGLLVMCVCVGLAFGLLAGKLLSDAENRKPPS